MPCAGGSPGFAGSVKTGPLAADPPLYAEKALVRKLLRREVAQHLSASATVQLLLRGMACREPSRLNFLTKIFTPTEQTTGCGTVLGSMPKEMTLQASHVLLGKKVGESN